MDSHVNSGDEGAPAARPHRKEASVESVEPAGLNQLKMYHTVNTNGIQTPQIFMRPSGAEKRKLQAASLKHQALKAPSNKLQAQSDKLQASSRKLQAQ